MAYKFKTSGWIHVNGLIFVHEKSCFIAVTFVNEICGALEHNVTVVNLFLVCYNHFSLACSLAYVPFNCHTLCTSKWNGMNEKKMRLLEYFDSRKTFVTKLKLQICHMLQPINRTENWWTQTFYDIDLVAPPINQSNFRLRIRCRATNCRIQFWSCFG